ncbi:transcriptional regulator NrdR [Thermanaerovibrio acidaminovorans]|uniref:Transcriptional repressor NrdR n=1 Tax=Thermanaerovibrio acidaminovorans (strain ATCC 49978 / DSM 6589 / Su883) TaxID=525903 RepID=D1B9B5_THEAS|nr:transcriptional regulator NrdR [Thermanaerovibrio acidaminovorans]ACZ18868.1 ATP-cone domain protein [Thermanaerovibrio acidaminovorans DSM 6589]
MLCPRCSLSETRVIETRTSEGGRVVRRRRECPSCGYRFTTYEKVEERGILWVVKKDGRRESFDRQKLLRGLMRACEKLPVPLDVLEEAASRIEALLRERESGEVLSLEVGDLAMEELRRINKVAYVRFASVYREFTDLSNFAAEIARLIEEREDKHDNH